MGAYQNVGAFMSVSVRKESRWEKACKAACVGTTPLRATDSQSETCTAGRLKNKPGQLKLGTCDKEYVSNHKTPKHAVKNTFRATKTPEHAVKNTFQTITT